MQRGPAEAVLIGQQVAVENAEEHSYRGTKASHGDNEVFLDLTVSGTLFTPQMFVKRGKVFYLYQEENVNRKDREKEGRLVGGGGWGGHRHGDVM